MQIPIIILPSLTKKHQERWNKYYVNSLDRKRVQEEGIWRRTQRSENSLESGWTSSYDKRRRIVHYLHEFDIVRFNQQLNLVLKNMYIYYSLSLPLKELHFTYERILDALKEGEWINTGKCDDLKIWKRGDLICVISEQKVHPEDKLEKRELPSDYRSLDVTIKTYEIPTSRQHLPWKVLSEGMRIKDKRGKPKYINDLSILEKLKPFHVEIGCGVSVEAGVPVLHHLHDLYCVTDRETNRFIFGGEKDNLIPRILCNPESEVPYLGELFSAAFIAEPTFAHKAFKLLSQHKYLVEPIMTNNFDGLAHRAGLSELFLRRYDETIPAVSFQKEAQSLLVIGSHADRRRVQARARSQGLQVVFLDPEGYYIDNEFIAYPLEGPQDQDFICQQPATKGLTSLCEILGIQA